MYYCKQQKLSERKVLRFTGFHSNVGKTFTGLASSVLTALRKAIAQKIHWEKLLCFIKIPKSHKTFLSVDFHLYGIVTARA